MNFFDVVIDMLKPSKIDSSQKIFKLVNIAKNTGQKSSQKEIEAVRSVLKKGWIEDAEKQVKNEVKRFNKALKVKSAFPEQTFNTLEKKVLTAYKKDIKKGQEPPKCKATLSAIQDLVREMTRYENELNEFAKSARFAKKVSLKVVKGYKARQRMAVALRDALSDMLQNSLFGLFSSEITAYFLHCIDLAKYLRQAEISAKKLGNISKKDAVDAVGRARVAGEWVRYWQSSDYWEDLADRIK